MASASPTLKYTPLAEISASVAAARKTFESGKTKSIEWRIQQLKAIKRLFKEKQSVIVSALRADLNRPELECVLAEILVVAAEVDHALDHIHEWVQPESVRCNTFHHLPYPELTDILQVATPPVLLPGSSFVQRDPLGVVS
jgi:aldehyde dehydrogenase (NAD+)